MADGPVAHGTPVAISFRGVLMAVLVGGFLGLTVFGVVTLSAIASLATNVDKYVALAMRQQDARAVEHTLIREELQLLAVILTYEQSDRDRVRAALMAQLSPTVRVLIEAAERVRRERESTRKGIPRQPDESPDSSARERRRRSDDK
jgi:uncharacterized metal-binding protein